MINAILLVLIFACSNLHAQRVEIDESGKSVPTGRRAAEKYINTEAESTPASRYSSGDAHFLSLILGGYVDSKAQRWGNDSSIEDAGGFTGGFTYRMGEWLNSTDFAIRVNMQRYDIEDANPLKLSLMPVFLIPDARAEFPLYFGAGAGLGVFLEQEGNESALSFDFSILAGVRFFDIYKNVGALLEVGLDSHFHLLSDGQYTGTYIAIGTVFTF